MKKEPAQPKIEIINLFPKPLGVYTFPEPVTKQELKLIQAFEKLPNEGNLVSKNRNIFNEKGMERIAAFCQQSVNAHFLQTICPEDDNLGLRITQSWVNYTEKDQWHHKHSHPNSFLSGVFYVQTEIATDKIIFFNDKQPYKITSRDFNYWNSPSWWWPSIPNTLLLFPATMEHSVDTKITTGTRISISFNTFFVGDIGEANESTHLRLEEPK